MVLSILNGRQHHLDAVTIKSDFGQIHSERQQRRDTPLLFMISTRAQRKMMKVILTELDIEEGENHEYKDVDEKEEEEEEEDDVEE